MTTKSSRWDFSNAGSGTVMVMTYLGLIPGVIPTLALTGVVVAVIVLPVLVLGLATATLLGPPYAIWRLATGRRRRGEENKLQTPTIPGM